ncbi:hypothetical protein ACLESO_16000 [Pyxidicoccus sp. 3LG]
MIKFPWSKPPLPPPPRKEPTVAQARPALAKPSQGAQRNVSTFEGSSSRGAALRQWSEQASGSTGLLSPVSGGGGGASFVPMAFEGSTGGVARTNVAMGLTGSAAYVELETRVQAATDAQQRVDDLEVQLTDDLALLGPTLTPEERTAYIESFRTEHADAYAARDAAVAAVAEHLEAEGANLEAYLEAHHEASPYTTPTMAQPLLEGLALVADSPVAATAVDFLTEHGALVSSVAAGAGYSLDSDVYGPAITATMSSALATGQTPDQAMAAVRTLIEDMPPSVQQRVLGDNPEAALSALSRVAAGDVDAITELSQLAAGLGTQESGALVSAALAMAMLTQPERFESPEALELLIGPLRNGSLGATVVSNTLKAVGATLRLASGLMATGSNAAVTAAGLAVNASSVANVLGKAGPTLSALASGLTVLQLLTQENPNNGTYLQAGAQAVGAAFAVGTLLGSVSFGVGLAATAGVFIVTELGRAWETRIRSDEVRAETIERATRFGLADAELRVNLCMNHPTQVRDLASLGLDYTRINELVSRGLYDTGSVVALARDFDLSPQEVDRLLGMLLPPGQTQADPGLLYFMQFYQQARSANPGAAPSDLVAWMQENRPPPTYGGVGYVFTDAMINLLASTL